MDLLYYTIVLSFIRISEVIVLKCELSAYVVLIVVLIVAVVVAIALLSIASLFTTEDPSFPAWSLLPIPHLF